MKKWLFAIIAIFILAAIFFIIISSDQKIDLNNNSDNIDCFRKVNISLSGNRGYAIGDVCYYTNLSLKKCVSSSDCIDLNCILPIAYENSTSEIVNFADVGSRSSVIAKDTTGYCLKIEAGRWIYVEEGKATFQYLAVDY